MTRDAAIQAMGNRIAQQFTPLRVILFGSHARGTDTAASDVDHEHGFLPKTPSQVDVDRYLNQATEIIARACGGKDALERKLREFEFLKLPDQPAPGPRQGRDT